MNMNYIPVYVEHKRKHLENIACNMPGWMESFNRCDGTNHFFDNIQHALDFVWCIRRHDRYVELDKKHEQDLIKYAKAKGYDNITGLISKFV